MTSGCKCLYSYSWIILGSIAQVQSIWAGFVLQIDDRRSYPMVSIVEKVFFCTFSTKFFQEIIFPSVSTHVKLKEIILWGIHSFQVWYLIFRGAFLDWFCTVCLKLREQKIDARGFCEFICSMRLRRNMCKTKGFF